ncbi:MAG: hypothetical protein PW735_02650 [Acidobacteriaceae bacterium]|nr:hypothetical protein [Acidobacteriaceae bacterium]
MPRTSTLRKVLLPLLCLGALPLCLSAQQASDPHATDLLRNAVNNMLQADKNDHSRWSYRERNKQPEKDNLFAVIDVPGDALKRLLVSNGHPLSAEDNRKELDRIDHYVHTPDEQDRRRRNDQRSDEQANALMRDWPQAFLVTLGSETPEFITLNYRPNPAYDGPTVEARVMSRMTGQMVVTRNTHQMYSLHGRLMQDVLLGFGLVRLKAGGNFDIERREVAPGHWEVVEEHTHIDGHALFFKSINQQEDDWKTEYKPSPANSLEEAERVLQQLQP